MKDKVHLEWVNGKTKITISFSEQMLFIRLYCNYPSNKVIELSISKCILDEYFRIINLVGNGFNSGVQCQGFGKLIFNIAIQAMRYHLEEIKGLPPASMSIRVTGETSSYNDPEDEPDKTNCWKRRNAFWQSFGFVFDDPKSPRSHFRCELDKLNYNNRGVTGNGTPTFIDIHEFQVKDDKPTLSHPDNASLS